MSSPTRRSHNALHLRHWLQWLALVLAGRLFPKLLVVQQSLQLARARQLPAESLHVRLPLASPLRWQWRARGSAARLAPQMPAVLPHARSARLPQVLPVFRSLRRLQPAAVASRLALQLTAVLQFVDSAQQMRDLRVFQPPRNPPFAAFAFQRLQPLTVTRLTQRLSTPDVHAHALVWLHLRLHMTPMECHTAVEFAAGCNS